MITVLRWLLLPFSLLYQMIIWLRNKMYDKNIFKSHSFAVPTIVIGNLSIGGAGKSPMIEYIIRLLQDKYRIATVSRGYGRKTKGFKVVSVDSKAIMVGDEPLQFKKKFPNINVVVCEDRCTAVQKLTNSAEVILLDDAYQHRKLKAGYYILLFDFNSLFEPLLTLPTGNFRDIFSATKRADLVVITKSPQHISVAHKTHIEDLIRAYTMAPIFYSSIQYEGPISLSEAADTIHDLQGYRIILFCGIANPKPLINYLESKDNNVQVITFADHHNYSTSDYHKVITKYENVTDTKKIIITTEKDVQRIELDTFQNYPLYYIPIKINLGNTTEASFDAYITAYLSESSNVNKH